MSKMHGFLCALSSFELFKSFYLDFAMNNNTQHFHHKLHECAESFYQQDVNARNKLLILVYASLIPLIISANLLSIFGIIKTKRNKFTSSQILFLMLFVSDLAIGVVQLPIQIYASRNASDQTCFEIELDRFSLAFLLFLSSTSYCVISIDRYIAVAHNKSYKRFVARKLLVIVIICVTLISFLWATLNAVINGRLRTVKLAKLHIAMSAYIGAVLAIGAILNLAVLKYVKRKRQNSSIKEAHDSSLTKTITMIICITVLTYLPIIIFFIIAAYSLINSKDKKFIQNLRITFLWVLIPFQLNAILNSVVYSVRNNRMRRYYYKLFHCRS